eukprot:COSAG01_NODE_1734_length_9366_cov_4.124636_12_plen_73_part_00
MTPSALPPAASTAMIFAIALALACPLALGSSAVRTRAWLKCPATSAAPSSPSQGSIMSLGSGPQCRARFTPR